MTDDKLKFVKLHLKKNEIVTFGNNQTCEAIEKGILETVVSPANRKEPSNKPNEPIQQNEKNNSKNQMNPFGKPN